MCLSVSPILLGWNLKFMLTLCSYETLGDWFSWAIHPPDWCICLVMAFIFNPPNALGFSIRSLCDYPSFLPTTYSSIFITLNPSLPTKNSERLRTVTVKALRGVGCPSNDSILFFVHLGILHECGSPLGF